MTILEILIKIRNGEKSPEDGAGEIKLLIGAIVDDAAIGIGNVDATEMYGEINRELEKI